MINGFTWTTFNASQRGNQMNYICRKCSVRQPVREDAPAPKCDCGQEMEPDVLNDKDAVKEGIYRHI